MFRGLVCVIIATIIVLAVSFKIAGGALLSRVRASKRLRTLCTFCDRPTRPDVDLYDAVHRRWCHATCRQQFLGASAREQHNATVASGALQRRQAC